MMRLKRLDLEEENRLNLNIFPYSQRKKHEVVGKVFNSQSPFEGLLRNKSLGLIRMSLEPYLLGKHKEN